MYYNDEQFTALAAIEHELRRAIDRNYARIPNRETLDNVRAAYMQATGLRSYPQNWGCTSCCINLLKDAGRLYFADKAELEKLAAQQEAERKAAEDAKERELTPASEEQETKTEETAEQETAPTEDADPANSDAKTETEETPTQPEEAAETAPKSKTTKTTKK